MTKTTLTLLFIPVIFFHWQCPLFSTAMSQSGPPAAIAGNITPNHPHEQITKTFSVVISESRIELSDRGMDRSDCAVVLPDGKIHIERRQQVLPNQPTTEVFKGQLGKTQLQEFRDILNTAKIRNLPSFTPPRTPVNVRWFHYFEVELQRDDQHQRIGYFKWRGNVPQDASPVSMPDDVKKAWQVSEAALQPLVQWFHTVQALEMKRTKDVPKQCRMP